MLLLLFLVLPLVELYVIVQVAGTIGALATLASLLVVSLVGAWLVKREGLGVMRRMQDTLGRGELPAAEVVDGGLLLMAGTMLVVPGFVTDLAGLVLLVPPVRALLRRRLLARWGAGDAVGGFGPGRWRGRVVDVEYVGDVTPTRPTTPISLPPPESPDQR